MDIADGPFGSNLKTEHYTDEKEARIIQLSNLSDYGWQEANTRYTTFEHAKEIRRCIVNEGELVMGKMMPAGMTIIRPNTEKMYVLSSDCVRIKLDKNVAIDDFFLYTTKSETFLNQVNNDSQGSTRVRTSISKIREMDIATPSLEEQAKIGEYFTNLDHLITLHQRKLEKLKIIKKSMLENCFPKNGEKIPKFRFDGFSGDWEQRKYSDIAITRRGLTYKPENIVDGGKRVLRSSNINEDTFEIHDEDVFVDEEAVNIPYVKNGDILITSANGSSRLVGKHAIIRNIPDNSVVHGGFMLLASSEEPEFVNALMSSQWYTKFINVYVAGGNGAIGNLNKNDLDEQLVLVPSKPEREKIGTYFSNLDNLITLHQRKLEKLKVIKKSMLESMFV